MKDKDHNETLSIGERLFGTLNTNSIQISKYKKEGNGVQIGTPVIYKGAEYKVLWIYDNGKCEIIKKNMFGKVELVAVSELSRI